MGKITVGAIDTRQDSNSYSVNIEIEGQRTNEDKFPIVIGGVKIYLTGKHDDLVKEIEKSVKRTINNYGKTRA